MAATVRRENAVGLAAPQCGYPRRVVVLPGRLYLVNLEVEPAGVATVWGAERCLSLRGRVWTVERYRTVRWRAHRLDGELTGWAQVTGQHARVLQHEFDHLAGTLICDHGVQREEPADARRA